MSTLSLNLPYSFFAPLSTKFSEKIPRLGTRKAEEAIIDKLFVDVRAALRLTFYARKKQPLQVNLQRLTSPKEQHFFATPVTTHFSSFLLASVKSGLACLELRRTATSAD